jgi:CDP-glucose 4,6-dehydratase
MGKMNLSFYKNKKVFITGHTGFKGSWLCRTLIIAGADVTGYALKPETKPALFELLALKKDMKSVIADIRDYSTLLKNIKKAKPEIIFHLAAQPLVRESYKQPVYTYDTNVLGTVKLLEACRFLSSARSIINVTTDKVYENREDDRAFNENENLCGYDPYSNSKSCSDIITYSYRNSFFHEKNSPALSTARSGNVIGGGDFAADRIIPDCVRAARKKKPFVMRNPESTRPYQHVLDCLSGYLLLAEKQCKNKKLQGSYNFGPEKNDVVNNAALVKMFCNKWGDCLTCITKSDNGPHEAKFLKLDITKAKKVLGWKPRLNVNKAVELTVEWSKEYLAGGDIVNCMDRQIKDYFKDTPC